MSSSSVFADDWRDCLCEHFMHVVRARDRITEESLVSVMYEVGFTDGDLAELRVRATLRVDDAPEDFAPDLDALRADEPAVYAVALPEHDREFLEDTTQTPREAEALEEEIVEEEPEPSKEEEDEDLPRQLGLF